MIKGKRGMAGAGLWVCGVLLVTATTASASAGPALFFSRADASRAGMNRVRLTLAVRAQGGAKLDAFSVRVERRPLGPVLSGFFLHSSRDGMIPVELEMLANHPKEGTGFELIDNGPVDEDRRAGTFAYTFDTRDWLEGEYVFQVSATGTAPGGQTVQRARRFVGILIGDARPAAEKVNVSEAAHRVIFKREGIYAPFPRLYILPDGRLAISHATRHFRSHIDETGGSAHWVSPDEGLTWEPLTEPLIDRRWLNAEGHVVDAGPEGWVYVEAAREPALRAQHKRIHSRPTQDGRIAYLGGARSRTSTDGGRTWSYRDISLPEGLRGLSGYSKAAAVLVTEAGTRLVAVHGSRLYPAQPEWERPSEVYFLRSDDEGASWTCHPMLPESLPPLHPGLNETALVQTPSGRLLALSRSQSSSSQDDHLWQSESDDEGLTWTAPVRTDIRGYPAHVIVLEDGRLLCAYGYRSDPMGIRAVTSSDEGRTWDLENELILRADGLGHRGDNGMPLLHQRADGSVIAIYYLTAMDGITHIASTLFRLP